MRNPVLVSVLGSVLLHSLASPAPARPGQAASMTVPVSVVDADQRLVPGLTAVDFEIRDNGKTQIITSVDSQPKPLSVVLLLDTSGSMKAAREPSVAAAAQFLNQLSAEDTAVVGGFAEKATFRPEIGLTSDLPLLRKGLRELPGGFPSGVFDALGHSIERLRGTPGRRAIVVLTDGEDNISRLSADEVTKRARAANVGVWVIGVTNEYVTGAIVGQQRAASAVRVRTSPDRRLKSLVAETGGNFLMLKQLTEWDAAFANVARELHQQYAVEFSPSAADGKVHTLEVSVKRASLTARAPRRYLAAPRP